VKYADIGDDIELEPGVTVHPDQAEPNRIGIQQRVIAYNQHQHALAKAAIADPPEFILPDLWRIIVGYAITIPVGPQLTAQVIPTFNIVPHRDKYTLKMYYDGKVLSRLKELFIEFYWFATTKASRNHWKKKASALIIT
jgi:hypothetical protein